MQRTRHRTRKQNQNTGRQFLHNHRHTGSEREQFFTGQVVALSGEWIEVELNPNTACDSCGLRVLCSPKGDQKRLLRLPNPGGLLQGQQVRLVENGLMTLKLAGLQYGLPLLGFVGGIFITWSQVQSPLWATVGGVAGLMACAVASYSFIRHWALHRSVVFFRILS